MNRLIIASMLTLSLSGCISSIEDSRAYNGPDSKYLSSRPDIDTAECIKKGWQDVFSYRPSDVWMTDKSVDGKYSVYTAGFIYLVDVKSKGSGSEITYYHNGDHLWGTKDKLIDKINRCL